MVVHFMFTPNPAYDALLESQAAFSAWTLVIIQIPTDNADRLRKNVILLITL